jgi:hypothetical protein
MEQNANCDLCKTPMYAATFSNLNGIQNVKACPNCMIMSVLEGEIKSVKSDCRCLLCDSQKVAALIHDFKFDEERTHVEYSVCLYHCKRLIRKNLKPADVLKMRAHFGIDTFQIHDDFYDEKGNALQPKICKPPSQSQW